MSRHFIKSLLVLLLLPLATSGIGAASKQPSSPIPDEWEVKWKMVIEDSDQLDLQDHWFSCGIKFRLRQYSDLFSCLDKLKVRTAKTLDADDPKRVMEPLFSGFLYSTALMELGQYPEALKYAKAAYAVLPRDIEAEKGRFHGYHSVAKFVGGTNLLNANAWGLNNPAGLNMKHDRVAMGVLANMAIIYSLQENPQEAADSISMIQKIGELQEGLLRWEMYKGNYKMVITAPLFAQKRYNDLINVHKENIREIIDLQTTVLVIAGGMTMISLAVNPLGTILNFGIRTGLTEFSKLLDINSFETQLDVFAYHYMLGASLNRTGKIDDAEKILDGLLAKPEIKDLGGIHWPILYERGLVAKNRGDMEMALKYFKESAEAIEKVRSSISIESSKIGFAGSKQAVYQDLVLAATSKGDWTAAFEYAERAKARAFVDMLAQKTDLAAPLAADEKIVALLARAEDREPILAIFDTDGLTRSAVIEARTQLNQVAPEAASLIAVNNVPLADVTSRLGNKEILINYYIAEKDLYAFLLSSAGIKGFKLSAEGLEEEIREFRSALQSAEANADTLGKRLYGRLIAPLEGEFKGARLTISPHGILHYLPFAALTDGSKYVVDKYSVRVMPSANSLAYVRSDKPIKTGKMLAFGNPELGNPRLDLPSAQEEAIRVAKMFPASKALVRKDASKTALKELGSGFSILHIASHGEFDSDAPLNSGLLLAKTETDEGRLTVNDLYSIRLDAELVTLSACETGLGKVANGDDVVGLTRGFMYAGARSIVSSLWQVDDAATATLMQSFYRNMAKNIEKREALRLAQVETKKSHPHPFYWGAFQITGAAN